MVEPERYGLLPTEPEENSGNEETIVEMKQLRLRLTVFSVY